MAKIIWREPANSVGGGKEQRREGSSASIAPMAKAGKDDKLEVNVDGAWYSAKLALGKDGITKVHYEGFSDNEDDDWNAEKIKSFAPLRDHLRVESEALQDEQCGLVRLKKVVCALRRVPNGEGWYDAVVTEINKRHHEPGAEGELLCTCSFTVVWLNGPDKGKEIALECGDICLLSTKDVETHPAVVEILRHVNKDDAGPPDEQQEEREDAKDDGEWVPKEVEPEEKVRPFKRLKSKSSHSAQVKPEPNADVELVRLVNDHFARTSHDTGVQDVPSPSHSTERKGAKKSSRPTSIDRKMRGQIPIQMANSIFPNADSLLWSGLKSKSVSDPSGEDVKNQVKQGVRISPNAGGIQEQRSGGATLKSKSGSDPSDEDIKNQGREEGREEVGISPNADGLLEQRLGAATLKTRSGSNPSGEDIKNQGREEVRICPNADGLQEQRSIDNIHKDLTEDEYFKVEVKKVNVVSQKADASQESKCQVQKGGNVDYLKADTVEEHCLSSQSSCFPHPKVSVYFQSSEQLKGSITSEFGDVDEKTHFFAKADHMPDVLIQQKWPGVDPISEPQGTKKVRITFNLDIDVGHGKITSCSANLHPSDPTSIPITEAVVVENFGLKKEALTDSEDKFPPGPQDQKFMGSFVKQEGCAASNAIYLSDEEGDCVGAGSTPPTPCTGFLDLTSEGKQQNGCKAHQDSRPITLRSMTVTKSGRVLQIDNLEVGVRPNDLMDNLLEICDKRRIQSVKVAPPCPQTNRARAYVIFSDTETAGAAAVVLRSGVVVSARGRPGVVNRPGQENSGSRKP